MHVAFRAPHPICKASQPAQRPQRLQLSKHRCQHARATSCAPGSAQARAADTLSDALLTLTSWACAVSILVVSQPSMAADIPSSLAQDPVDGSQRLSSLLSGDSKQQGREIEACTKKCVPTCVRGGSNGGAPGLGPISIRREVIVFKDGFRSRSYCLTECANVCSLSIKGPAPSPQDSPLPEPTP